MIRAGIRRTEAEMVASGWFDTMRTLFIEYRVSAPFRAQVADVIRRLLTDDRKSGQYRRELPGW